MNQMILSPENEEFLQHFGVKGMRWGVRKKRKSSNKRKAYKDLTDKEKKERIQTYAKRGVRIYAAYKIGKMFLPSASVLLKGGLLSVTEANVRRSNRKWKEANEATFKAEQARKAAEDAIDWLDLSFTKPASALAIRKG